MYSHCSCSYRHSSVRRLLGKYRRNPLFEFVVDCRSTSRFRLCKNVLVRFQYSTSSFCPRFSIVHCKLDGSKVYPTSDSVFVEVDSSAFLPKRRKSEEGNRYWYVVVSILHGLSFFFLHDIKCFSFFRSGILYLVFEVWSLIFVFILFLPLFVSYFLFVFLLITLRVDSLHEECSCTKNHRQRDSRYRWVVQFGCRFGHSIRCPKETNIFIHGRSSQSCRRNLYKSSFRLSSFSACSSRWSKFPYSTPTYSSI